MLSLNHMDLKIKKIISIKTQPKIKIQIRKMVMKIIIKLIKTVAKIITKPV